MSINHLPKLENFSCAELVRRSTCFSRADIAFLVSLTPSQLGKRKRRLAVPLSWLAASLNNFLVESVNSINTLNTQKLKYQLNLLQKGEGEAADGCFSFP